MKLPIKVLSICCLFSVIFLWSTVVLASQVDAESEYMTPEDPLEMPAEDLVSMQSEDVVKPKLAQREAAKPRANATPPSKSKVATPAGKASVVVENKLETPISSLTAIESESDRESTVLTAKFSSQIEWEKPVIEDHGTFIQIPLVKTIILEPGKFYEGNSPYIHKVAAFQITPEKGALRLFLNKDAAKLKSAWMLDVLGDRLILQLKHRILENEGLTDHQNAASSSKADDVIARTDVRSDIADPAAMTMHKKEASDAMMFGKDEDFFKDKLVSVTIFLGTLLIGFLAFHIFRIRLVPGKKQEGSEKIPVMKPISTYSIAPKHKLTLMQIGNEQILISVSPIGIQYLTTINKNTIKQALLPGEARYDKSSLSHGSLHRDVEKKSYEPAITPPLAKKDPARNYGKQPLTTNIRASATENAAAGVVADRFAASQRKSTFSVAIDDGGIKTLNPLTKDEGPLPAQTIEDVTRLIRRKLKNLPSF